MLLPGPRSAPEKGFVHGPTSDSTVELIVDFVVP